VQDVVDLSTMPYAGTAGTTVQLNVGNPTATVSNGTLTETFALSSSATSTTITVTEGSQIAMLTFLGDYRTSTWTFSSDGSNGTKIVDPLGSVALVDSGGTLTLNGPSAEHVVFMDSTRTLVLAAPSHFTGTISAAS